MFRVVKNKVDFFQKKTVPFSNKIQTHFKILFHQSDHILPNYRLYHNSETPPKKELESIKNIVKIANSKWKSWENENDKIIKNKISKELISDYIEIEKQILNENPENLEYHSVLCGIPLSDLWYRTGILYLEINENTKASKVLSKAVKMNPNSYDYQFSYAKALVNSKEYEEAIKVYNFILSNFSSLFQKSKQLPQPIEAPEHYNFPIYRHLFPSKFVIFPESKLAENLYQRALCYYSIQSIQDSTKDWTAVTKLQSNHRSSSSWAWLGKIAAMYGKWQNCIDFTTKALEYNPENLSALENRQTALIVLGKKEQAKNDFKRFSIIAHDKLWGLSQHPELPNWSEEI